MNSIGRKVFATYPTTFDWICVSKRVVLQQLFSVRIHYKGALKSLQGSEQLWTLIKLNLRIFLLEVFAEVILMDPKGKRGRCFTVRAPSWQRSFINSDGRDFGREARAPMFREQGVRHSELRKICNLKCVAEDFFCCLMWIRDWCLVDVHQSSRIHVNNLENWCLQISFREWSLLHDCFLSRFCTLPWEIHSIDQVDWDWLIRFERSHVWFKTSKATFVIQKSCSYETDTVLYHTKHLYKREGIDLEMALWLSEKNAGCTFLP